MSKKKVPQHLYVIEDIKLVNHKLRYVELENKCLYSYSGKRYTETKIKKENLPKSFIYGRYYKRFGYIDSANIKEIVYCPHNFFCYDYYSLKDDSIFITYNDSKSFHIWGNEIISMLNAAKKYSNFDNTKIKEQIWENIELFNNSERADKKILTKEEFEKWWEE